MPICIKYAYVCACTYIFNLNIKQKHKYYKDLRRK